MDRRTRRLLHLHGTGLVLLLLAMVALLAVLSTRMDWQADWTAGGRNTLSDATLQVLERLEGPLSVTAFARESGLPPARPAIDELLARYRRAYPALELRFVNPDTAPGLTRELGISVDGELVIEYDGRSEHVTRLSEEALTNALQRLARGGGRRLGFLTGHGERAPHGQANHDLGVWVAALAAQGFEAHTVHLGETGAVPADVDVLVLASAQVRLLAGEVALLDEYLRTGGNLLWLREPGEDAGLELLEAELGAPLLPGTVVDPSTRALGLSDPSFALITRYPAHPVTRDLQFMTILPQACALGEEVRGGWQRTVLLQTVESSWAETGPLEGTIRHDPETEAAGPLTVGIALTRARALAADTAEGIGDTGDNTEAGVDTEADPVDDRLGGEQRVAIICDGDFLSNTYLKNQGNEALGMRLMNWLASNDRFIEIPAIRAPDTRLALSERTWAWLGLLFLLVLPAGLLGSGLALWWQRRRR